MNGIKFPKMFNTTNTNVWRPTEYKEITQQNASILLQCERGEMFSDPFFGTTLKHYLFEQNNYVLRDQIIDVVYTQLAIFLPQLRIERNNIEIIQDREKGKLYCNFHATNLIDYQHNNYNLVLFDTEEM